MNTNQILKLFGGKLHVNKKLQQYVCRAMATLPDDIVRHITSDCWFLGSVEDAWAYTFRGDELASKHLIVLSDSLLNQSAEDICWTIIHEIGHVVLGHQNSILTEQSRSEVAKQENEADEFARRFLKGSP